MSTKRVIFIGAGAVGTYLGGWLSHLGHDVTLFDPWAEQVETIRRDGLSVSGPHEPFTARPRLFHLHESERVAREPQFEIGFVSVKAYDTPWAAQFIKRYVQPGGYFVSAQNTWPDPAVAAAVGAENAVGLIMSSISVSMMEAGKVTRPGKTRQRDLGHEVFRAGEHDGRVTSRLHELIEMLDPIDAGKVTDNLWGERWAKLCQNAMGNPVVGLADAGMATISKDPRGRELQIRLACESAKVGLALGYRVENFGGAPAKQWAQAEDGTVYEALDAIVVAKSGGANWRPSMGQDVLKGRPTEINEMNGHILRKAREAGIDVPVTAATVEVVRGIDAGKIRPGWDNVALVLKKAGFPA